jgi:hypothetical protein
VNDAIYQLLELHPENEHAVDLLNSGFQGVLVLVRETPEDVQVWLKSEGNDYHEGSGFSLPEQIFTAGPAQAKWLTFAKGKAITVRSTPAKGPLRYDALREKFLEEHFPFDKYYGTYSHFKNCLELFNLWTELEILDTMKDVVHHLVDVLNVKVEFPTVIKNLLYLSKQIMDPKFRGAWGMRGLTTVLKVHLPFYMPCRQEALWKDGAGRRLPKLQFFKVCPTDGMGPRILNCPMGDTITYKKKDDKKKRTRTANEVAEAGETTSGTGRRRRARLQQDA